jgi:adenosylhomocysteine nucleosidase
MTGPTSARVGVLVPMPMELGPVRRAMSLRSFDDGDRFAHVYAAHTGATEVVAMLTGIGTRNATRAAERLLDRFPVDHVLVVGIAGGVGEALDVGALVVPEVVVDGDTMTEYRSTPLDGSMSAGRLETSDDFLVTDDDIAKFVERGVVAVDMETASIAAVCTEREVPWSAFRGISDRAGETPVEVAGLAKPDGSPDFGAVARYVLPRPWRMRRLARLNRDAKRAAEIAAAAAASACAHPRREALRSPQ